jgi:hypothetical protein
MAAISAAPPNWEATGAFFAWTQLIPKSKAECIHGCSIAMARGRAPSGHAAYFEIGFDEVHYRLYDPSHCLLW